MTTAPEPRQSGVRFGQASSASRAVPTFGRGGSIAGAVAVVALLGGLLWVGASGHAATASHPRIFGGSLVLEDQRPLTVIDVATAKVTVRLQGIDAQVGAPSYGEVQAVPVSSGTLLVDRKTGTFNLLGRDDYVVDAAGPGIGLGSLPGSTAAGALPAGPSAYIIRYAPRSTVSLVDESTVLAGARQETGTRGGPGVVAPRGFAQLSGQVADRPGSAVVDPSNGNLWMLVSRGRGCELVELRPSATARQGLVVDDRASFSVECVRAAVESVPGTVAVATPGQVRVFATRGTPTGRTVSLAATSDALGFLPVTGTTTKLWFLVRSAKGWAVAGVDPKGRTVGPAALARLGGAAQPATPAESGGDLYTVDQASDGQPELWRILPSTGAMAPVRGEPAYPARGPTEKASFQGAQVIVEGPRVVFNNPGSLLAVVVFTDGTHAPVVVDKSAAVTVSATGPADVGVTAPAPGQNQPPNPLPGEPPPAVQPVSKQVTCATTTQKPYAPQITSVSVSSSSALVAWSYELLDQTDCEPDSWSVRVTALNGGHQPAVPLQLVNGQSQLMFTGLRPATTYQAVVTAYINAQSTPSPPATFTTAARGPDAPTAVSTASDGKGDWVVSWTPCAASDCYVPADTWNVIGSACGTSFVGKPPTVQVPGNQTSVVVSADPLGLLGDSMSFSVQGSLASGLLGSPTADSACTPAWRPPDSNFIGLDGSGEPSGQTITATLAVTTSEPAVEAFGSGSTEFVYQVGGNTVGPTSATSVTVSGLTAGDTYTPSVVIYPSGHPEASVTVTGRPFSKNLIWPADLSMSVQPTVDSSNPNEGTIQLAFANLPPGPMSVSGTYTCGSTQSPQFQGLLAGAELKVPMDLVAMGGSCRVTATVSDQDPTVYGRPSDPMSQPFSIGTQPDYSFSASIPQSCQQSVCLPQQVEIQYTGQGPLDRGGAWKITAKSKGGLGGGVADPCADSVSLQAPPSFPYSLALPTTCIDASQIDVAVSWMYLGTTATDDLGTPKGHPEPPPTTTTTTTTTTTATTTGTTIGTTTGTTINPTPHSATSTTSAAKPAAAGLAVVASFVGLAGSRASSRKRKTRGNR